jgi:hypothetical protein
MINIRSFCALALLLSFALTACDDKKADVDLFVREVEAVVPWTDIPPDRIDAAGKTFDALGQKFQSFSIDEARQVIVKLIKHAEEKGVGWDADGYTYVLLRYYFSVSNKEPREKFPIFAGWQRVPGDRDNINALWPLGLNNQGIPVLKHCFRGYVGAPYDALDEFDFLACNYKPRRQQ